MYVWVDWICVRDAAGICSKGFSVPFGLSDREHVALSPDFTYHSNAASVNRNKEFTINFFSASMSALVHGWLFKLSSYRNNIFVLVLSVLNDWQRIIILTLHLIILTVRQIEKTVEHSVCKSERVWNHALMKHICVDWKYSDSGWETVIVLRVDRLSNLFSGTLNWDPGEYCLGFIWYWRAKINIRLEGNDLIISQKG